MAIHGPSSPPQPFSNDDDGGGGGEPSTSIMSQDLEDQKVTM